MLPFVDSNPQQRIRDPLLRIRTGALPARPPWPRGNEKGLEVVFVLHVVEKEGGGGERETDRQTDRKTEKERECM